MYNVQRLQKKKNFIWLGRRVGNKNLFLPVPTDSLIIIITRNHEAKRKDIYIPKKKKETNAESFSKFFRKISANAFNIF